MSFATPFYLKKKKKIKLGVHFSVCILDFPNRSPSPEPIYNSEGKRLNTREYRTRKKLEEERHSLITEMVGLNPEFKPPADYK